MFLANKDIIQYSFILLSSVVLFGSLLFSNDDKNTHGNIKIIPAGSIGIVEKYDSRLDDEMSQFFLEQFIIELESRNLFKIKNLDEIQKKYRHIIRNHDKQKNNYPSILNFLNVDFLLIFSFKTKKQNNDKFSFNFILENYNRHLGKKDDYLGNWELKNFEEIVSYLPDIVDALDNNVSSITLDEKFISDSEIFITNNNTEIIYSYHDTSYNQKINAGVYNLVIQKSGHFPIIENTLIIKPKKKYNLSYSLAKIDVDKVRKLAMQFPGRGHQYIKQPKIAQRWYIAEGVSLALSAYFLYDYLQQKNNYDDMYNLYLTDPSGGLQFTDDLTKLDQNKNRNFNLFITFSATSLGTWIWNYIDINKKINDPNIGKVLIPNETD